MLFAAISCLLVLAASSLSHAPQPPFHLPWWSFVPAFACAEALTFRIEVRNDSCLFSLSDLPLVVGLFFAAPWAVVVGGVLGHLIFRAVEQRRLSAALVLNVGAASATNAAVVVVFRLVDGGRGPMTLQAWGAVLVAVLAGEAVGLCELATTVVRIEGASRLWWEVTTRALTAIFRVSVSLLAATILWASPKGLAPFGLMVLAMVAAFRGYFGLRQRYSSLESLYDFTRTISAPVNAEAVIDDVLSEARRLLRASSAEIVVLDNTSGVRLHRLHSRDQAPGPAPSDRAEILARGTAWMDLVRDGRPVVMTRGSHQPVHQAFLRLTGADDCMLAPLQSDDRVIAVMMVADRDSSGRTFDDGDLQLFAALANHASVAFENGRLIDQLRREAVVRHHEATHDPLTGLANRTLFLQRLASLVAGPAPARQAAIMLMDLDRFKEVNDTMGHHNGDLLLQEVGRRVSGELRPQDLVARLGGDEFAVLLTELESAERTVEIAEHMRALILQPFRLGDVSVEVGASVGIAIYPLDGQDVDTLLQRADVAMYDAKGSPEPIARYSADRDHHTLTRLTMAAELRGALRTGQMVAYYQPKVRLSDGVVVGTEALARWRHPVLGLVSPQEFIAVAEQTGVIEPLTLFMLREAINQCRQWRRRGKEMTVSVNLAVRSLLDPSFPDAVEALLTSADLPGSCLTLEITESGVMADPVRAQAVLERLSSLGIGLSVDDFGTGYSSLSYLRKLPVREMKLDRSFVSRIGEDADDAALVQSIIDLGHNLGLRVVAEGVEDQKGFDLLRGMGCDEAQGFFLSQPVPAQDMAMWLPGAANQERKDSRRSVLVVDDDWTLRRVVRSLLDENEVLIHEARDGLEAIALANEHQPDLIVLDLVMPRMGGIDALPELRAAAPSTKVIILTGVRNEEAVVAAAEGGAVRFLNKAQDLPDLADTMRLLLAS